MSNIINRTLLAKYSPLPQNYNFAEIENYIPVAQEIWIRPLIGDDLMDELEEQVKNNNLTEANQALMTEGFLLQYLGYAVCLEGLPFIWVDFCEKGITISDSEHSKSITLKDLTLIQDHLRREVEFLKDTVKKYVMERPDYFPQVNQCPCECNCSSNPKLNRPNPMMELYSARRRNTNLK